MSDSGLKQWAWSFQCACACVFLAIQARSSFVESWVLQSQLEASRSMVSGLIEEAEQLESNRAKKAEQVEAAVEREKFYAAVLDDLVEASRTSSEAWALTQRWNIQPTGGKPIPPPPPPTTAASPAPQQTQPRLPSRTQSLAPSLSTPFIPIAKPPREKTQLKLGN